MTHRVSIVIPTFNRPILLKRALESVRAQTFTDYDVIVVDDGDKVRSKDVVDAFGDRRFTYIANEPPRQGGAQSRNIGIKAATNDFIAFLDDDDEWLPEKLELQMKAFGETPPEVGFCIAGAKTQSEQGEALNLPRREGIADFSDLALIRFAGFLTTTLILKRAVIESVGMFDATFPSHQETELMIRVTRKFKGLALGVPLVIMNMFDHEHIGGNIERRIKGREMLLEKHLALYAPYPKALGRHYFQIGLWCRDSGKMSKAKSYFFKAFGLTKNPRYLGHALLVLYKKDLVCQ